MERYEMTSTPASDTAAPTTPAADTAKAKYADEDMNWNLWWGEYMDDVQASA